LSYPTKDILQLADDLSAAFRHILYHPTLAVAFASVWKTYVVIPVGAIFGACNSPSFYMEAGEAQAHLAMHMPNAAAIFLEDLATKIVLPTRPSPALAATFAQARADFQHSGIARPHGNDPE